MPKLVTIFGGAGFLGRYIARRMAKEGWRVRVAVRRPNEALHVRPYGVVGQVEPVFCNIRDDASVRAAMDGADAVVNCVGTFDKSGKNNFDAVHVDGAGRIARIATELGVSQMTHISAIGADAGSSSLYAKTKARGEEAVLAHKPDAIILRPSVLFGTEDQFFNRFSTICRYSMILPLVGGNTKFQPVYVDDVAKAAAQACLGQVDAGIYELGGPDVRTFRGLMEDMLEIIHRRRLIVNMPFWLGTIIAPISEVVGKLSLGLVPAQITSDQVRSLKTDNVVSEGAQGFEALGITPTAYELILPEYLWRFRPTGQFDAIKDSAKNLRTQ
ncbi:complex I NDUFA9 subunit family protein [uncultured Pelagimonas sp.]|uniref:complex I NDUFA9 subunit family protein n=1 Tax=uncultured Pelagimonas sp. TaxID=1618102 RepID=UPI00260573AA|nr:complex I NDUFA9 subunit family protein [uncultured Pelagimonas sp.]